MNNLKIDIVIATYNRSGSLQKTLMSLIELQHPTDCIYEILVVDNGSKDNTKDMVQDMAQRFPNRIQYLSALQNGKTYALNKALSTSSGDVMAMTDDDVVVEPNWLSVIAENFHDETLQCLTGRIIPVYREEKPSWYSPKLSTVMGEVDISPQRVVTKLATGANMAVRRSVLEKIGGFGHYQGVVNEDTIISHKLRDCGVHVVYDPQMIVYHYFQKEKFTLQYFKRWYWLSGRTIAAMNEEIEKTQKNKLFGIPLWRIRQVVEHLKEMLGHLNVETERFFHELQIRRFGGFCYERWFGKKENYA